MNTTVIFLVGMLCGAMLLFGVLYMIFTNPYEDDGTLYVVTDPEDGSVYTCMQIKCDPRTFVAEKRVLLRVKRVEPNEDPNAYYERRISK